MNKINTQFILKSLSKLFDLVSEGFDYFNPVIRVHLSRSNLLFIQEQPSSSSLFASSLFAQLFVVPLIYIRLPNNTKPIPTDPSLREYQFYI